MTGEPTPCDLDRRCVLVTKNGHRYVFSYQCGQERELYFALIDCARDPESVLAWPEVLIAMQHVPPFPAHLPPKP